MKKVVFIKNALILTATSLILRLLGVFFKVWMAKFIGSEGIGLYQLVFSFYVLASTFASGGISVAVTRLVSNELLLGSKNGVKKIMLRSFLLTFFIAFLSFCGIEVFAHPIATVFLGDQNAVLSLRILAFSLFFMGASSCIKGYFIARRKTLPPSSAQIFEQIVRLSTAFVLFINLSHLGVAYMCAAVLLADTIAELFSCLYLYVFYKKDVSCLESLGRSSPPFSVLGKLLHISGPITGGRYINSGLRTIENVLVPKQLMLFGLTGERALSFFGVIKGMALPILFFPSTLLGSITTLLIPEISGAAAIGDKRLISRLVKKVLRITALIGFIFGGMFFVCGEQLGILIYNDAISGRAIKFLAPLVPLMYIDSISDGILKGLDLQGATFRHSIFDSTMRIVLIWFLLPIYGEIGFIAIMYVSNLLTAMLNLVCLIKKAQIKVDWFGSIIFPLISTVGITLCVSILFKGFADLPFVILVGGVSLILYIMLLFLSKTLTKEELQGFIH